MARNIPERISDQDTFNTSIGGEMAKLGHLFEESPTARQSSRSSEDSIPTAESCWHNWDYGSTTSCLFEG